MKLRLLILSLMVMCSVSCKSAGPVIETVVVDTACKWVEPIYISKKDVLTDGTARQILTHNNTVDRNCPQAERAPAQKPAYTPPVPH